MRLMSSESSHSNGGYEHTPTSYGEGTGSVLSPLGETSLSKMVGCSLFQVYFCCCDRTVKISLGGEGLYSSKFQVTDHHGGRKAGAQAAGHVVSSGKSREK